MKLSSKSKYGLKACYELAMRRNEGPISLASLVESSGTTLSHLEQLMIPLKKNNIVKATRGAQGGYYLARENNEISIGEILRALEDGLKIIECINTKCEEKKLCPTHSVWQKMYDSLNNMLDSYTLQSMLDSEVDK